MDEFDLLIKMYREAGEELGIPFERWIETTETATSPTDSFMLASYLSAAIPKEDNKFRILDLQCKFKPIVQQFTESGFIKPIDAKIELQYTGDFDLLLTTTNPEFGAIQLKKRWRQDFCAT